MTTILLAIGNLVDKYPNISASRRARIEQIAKHIGLKLSSIPDVKIITGGRKRALSSIIISHMEKKFREKNVYTYIPKLEIDKSNKKSEYVRHGILLERGSYTEDRRLAMVNDADIVVIGDGNRGVSDMYAISKRMNKRILPISFGVEDNNFVSNEGKVFESELHSVSNKELVDIYKATKNLMAKPETVAASFCELLNAIIDKRLMREVFVALPMTKESASEMDDLKAAILRVGAHYGFRPVIIADTDGQKPIIEEIVVGIERSCLAISVFDYNRPNIYFEAGYAKGLMKPVILCSNEKYFSEVAFDTKAYEIVVWKSYAEFERKLMGKIEKLIEGKRLQL